MDKKAAIPIKKTEQSYLFSNRALLKLFFPLLIEQFLEQIMGLTASMLVAFVGEAAVSGVSLVEFIMALLINIFVALSTGGAVVVGQYLGNKQNNKANTAANQLVWFTGITAIVIMIGIYLLHPLILNGLFGQISSEVYFHSRIYLLIMAASIPFLGLYNAVAAIFRTMKNSKLPMKIMLTMNLVNVLLTALLIFVFNLGTAGVALSTLICRAGAAIAITIFALNKNNLLHLTKSFKFKFNPTMIKRILRIGVPTGFESGMFYFGRLLVCSLISTFGTAAIAANSVGGTLARFEVMSGMAVNLGLTVVVAHCIGYGDYQQAKYYIKKILGILYLTQIVCCAIVLSLLPTMLKIYSLSEEATVGTSQIVWLHAIMTMLFWPLANAIPVIFRASGDVKFPMIVSIASMIFCRIFLSYVLGVYFNLGMIGTWIAIYIDWIVKSIIFIWHYFNGKWMRFNVIER